MTSPPSGRSTAAPSWKVLLALLSLVLATAVWVLGLVDSFAKPSVAPALSLEQQELTLLAEPQIPSSLRTLLLGADASDSLLSSLRQIPLDRLDDRQKILFTALETDPEHRRSLQQVDLESSDLLQLQRALAKDDSRNVPAEQRSKLLLLTSDPLNRRLACEALGGEEESCLDQASAKRAARRLVISELLPLLALLLGGLLLLRHLWQLLRRRLPSWPTLLAPPLGVLDMVLLVAGGFVVLGEVLMPLLVIPISSAFSRGLSAPLSQGVNVFLGYVALAGPPLLILRQQLAQLDRAQMPPQGWLQWRLQPLGSALLQGARGWLMVLPPVVLSGWLITRLIGDQGGSNPLLEIVLNSQDPLALLLLSLTAVVLAPLFEETIFRGVLLPVLGQFLGRSGGVLVSALVFAVAHLSIGELAPLLVLGLGLGLLRLSTGRLLPCVVMHALWNGVTFLNLVLLGG
ncbi:CPBP family intramembrane glutamic endopeptidase [Synechococcus sp. MIT S9504]|uniref:CPBP family intramembrane glutamic endopeptidase n=1 Tax=Synechococcus sp. MIT S9504 TaxID=1801628 RepID=UPI00083410B9|nr:type II CAAX endopeptidase family protein [Synechococcus sp. MIT S9504]